MAQKYKCDEKEKIFIGESDFIFWLLVLCSISIIQDIIMIIIVVLLKLCRFSISTEKLCSSTVLIIIENIVLSCRSIIIMQLQFSFTNFLKQAKIVLTQSRKIIWESAKMSAIMSAKL